MLLSIYACICPSSDSTIFIFRYCHGFSISFCDRFASLLRFLVLCHLCFSPLLSYFVLSYFVSSILYCLLYFRILSALSLVWPHDSFFFLSTLRTPMKTCPNTVPKQSNSVEHPSVPSGSTVREHTLGPSHGRTLGVMNSERPSHIYQRVALFRNQGSYCLIGLGLHFGLDCF